MGQPHFYQKKALSFVEATEFYAFFSTLYLKGKTLTHLFVQCLKKAQIAEKRLSWLVLKPCFIIDFMFWNFASLTSAYELGLLFAVTIKA